MDWRVVLLFLYRYSPDTIHFVHLYSLHALERRIRRSAYFLRLKPPHNGVARPVTSSTLGAAIHVAKGVFPSSSPD